MDNKKILIDKNEDINILKEKLSQIDNLDVIESKIDDVCNNSLDIQQQNFILDSLNGFFKPSQLKARLKPIYMGWFKWRNRNKYDCQTCNKEQEKARRLKQLQKLNKEN